MAKHTRKLDQIDLIDYIESLTSDAVDTEPCRIQYRVEIMSDGRHRTGDYSHLPYDQRPLAQYQQTKGA